VSEIRDALDVLGITRFVLAIHDVSFPSHADEDTGRGSPYSRGAADFLGFVGELGFDGVQLGPQGATSLGNASPYDGAVFSKSLLSVVVAELAEERWAELLPRDFVEEAVRATPAGDSRAHYRHAYGVHHAAVARAARTLRQRVAGGDGAAHELARAIDAFARGAGWLTHDARFEAFATLHGTDDFREWPESDRAPSAARIAEVVTAHEDAVWTWVFGQYVLDASHRALRDRLGGELGLRLYGDLQVGLSLRDRWTRGGMFLDRLRMGAPPSRTNPEGQPWGYPVLDPRQYLRRSVGDAEDGAPLAFVRARIGKMFEEFDGVRIDHPHGLVCPWVYDGHAEDPDEAVRVGARLFESPGHPDVGAFAIAREDQIDAEVAPYDDDRVHGLDDAQVAEYARLFDVVMEAAQRAGRDADDVLCEVLSTCPAPLACVMQRYGLGRFRVTQKASLVDETDGYRGENARPRDWTMLGNHDTSPLLAVVERWQREGTVRARAAYLATRLEPDATLRAAFAARVAGSVRELATAMFAELFVGPASNVLVFWADLFGERAAYNTPGLVSDANWSMRVPRDFRGAYAARVARGEALDVRAALAMALRARGGAFAARHAALIARLAGGV